MLKGTVSRVSRLFNRKKYCTHKLPLFNVQLITSSNKLMQSYIYIYMYMSQRRLQRHTEHNGGVDHRCGQKFTFHEHECNFGLGCFNFTNCKACIFNDKN